jgi:hypothetical protein
MYVYARNEVKKMETMMPGNHTKIYDIEHFSTPTNNKEEKTKKSGEKKRGAEG